MAIPEFWPNVGMNYRHIHAAPAVMPALVSRPPEIELVELLFTRLVTEVLLKEPLPLPIVLIAGPACTKGLVLRTAAVLDQ
jgi:hypothetical protein